MNYSTVIFIGLLSVTTHVSFADESISYPQGYRHWTHVKTLTLHKGHALETPFKGIHHIYANPIAIKGLKQGNHSDGAKIVFDLLESNTANHATSEGKRVLVGVMVKDNKRFSKTGGWGFEAWKQNSRITRLTNDKGQSCFACHTSQKKSDYVFSKWRN